MKPCISQATTLRNSFEADAAVFSRNGWTAVEIWLTKLEAFLNSHTLAEAARCWNPTGSDRWRRRRREGCSCPRALSATHWEHFERRLALLGELGVPTLIVTPDFVQHADALDHQRAAAALGEAARAAATHGVRIALEFQKSSPICACLETAMALIAHSGADNVGVCLDVFHYYTGPSKFEDLAYLSRRNLAWVQFCDLSGTPRELAGDADRILPGEGDFQLGPIVEHLGRIGYDGYVSLEVLNPHLWQVDPDRVADLGRQALERVLGRCESDLLATEGGP